MNSKWQLAKKYAQIEDFVEKNTPFYNGCLYGMSFETDKTGRIKDHKPGFFITLYYYIKIIFRIA